MIRRTWPALVVGGAALLPALPVSAQEVQAPQVSAQPALLAASARVGRIPGRTRLVIDLDGSPDYRVEHVPGSAELWLEVRNARLQSRPAADLFAGSQVSGWRLQESADAGFVLRLQLAGPTRAESFSLEPDYYGGHRLVVDLYDAAGAAPVADSVEPVAAVAALPEVAPEAGPPAAAEAARVEQNLEQSAGHRGGPIRGWGEFSAAYTYGEPDHWSQLRTRFDLSTSGRIGTELRYHLGVRAEADGAFQLEDHYYPEAVKRDQQADFSLREAYIDTSVGGWDYRLGRQQIVWGEVVGLFLADVVSAKDTREFFLPEFDTMRIPQWAVRAEKFAGESHFELLWVPYQSYDEIGKPGADFYPFPVPPGTPVEEDVPSRSDLGNSSIGARYSRLLAGWDLTGFFYQSNDVSPTLYQFEDGLELRHDRIDQVGGTFSKAWLDLVLKGEMVYTAGRSYPTLAADAFGAVVESDALEYVVGAMLPRGDWRFDVQLYARHLLDHQRGMVSDADEFGITLLANYSFSQRFEAELLYLAGLNRSDYSFQPSVTWNLNPRWRLQFGADIFAGDELGFYGRYDERDRVFVALRRWL